MRVACVVPSWNAGTRIEDVLAALAGQVDYMVVVDNGSTDSTADIVTAEYPAAALRASDDNNGFSAAVNSGIRMALRKGADAALLVNDDALFGPGSVELLADALEHDPSAGATTAKMLYRDRPSIINGTGGYYDPGRAWAQLRGEGEPDVGQYDHLECADYPSGGASLIRMSALDQVGAFDEEYFLYYEDVDWGLRALEAGWRTRYVSRARVLHGGSTGTRCDPARRRYYNVRNRLKFAARHAPLRGRAHVWMATLALLAKQPVRWTFSERRRDAEAVAFGVADHLARRYGRSGRYG